MKTLLVLLAILSLSSTSHLHAKRRNIPNDLSWLFSLEESDQSNDENNDVENEIIEHKKAKVCETEECRMIAQAFHETMDKSVDPCDNFYEFACGGWAAKKPIPKYEASWSRFLHFQSTVENRIRDLLEEKSSNKDILPVRQAKKWYRSCMDTEAREARGLKPIESFIMQNGGWPMIMDAEEWHDDEMSWQEVEAFYTRLTGESTFWKIEPMSMPDEEPDRGIIFFRPSLPFEEDLPTIYRNYTGEDYKVYQRMIQGIAKLFIDHTRADVSEEQLEEDIDGIIKLERMIYMATNGETLFDILDELEDDLDETDLDTFFEWWGNKTKAIKDPQAIIDWKKVLQNLFDIANVEVEGSFAMAVASSRYYRVLPKILQSTDKRTIVNYIHWKFVSQTLKYTIDEVKDLFFELVKDEYDVKERQPHWRECVKEVKMTDAAALVFIGKYIKESSYKAVLRMMKNIQKELKCQIENSNWITEEGKKKAMEKVDKMQTFVGFPEWYKNKTAVINHYKGLTIGNEYLDNVLSYMRYEKKLAIRTFGGYKGNEAWMMDPLTVNAAYAMGMNIMVVPAVDFQPPLFGDKVPNYVNYGTAGVVIGHEMGHGLDYAGLDTNASIHENMAKFYYQQARCFIDQFDEYYGGQTFPPSPYADSDESPETRGKGTVQENIADTTGIQSVLRAYKHVQKNRRPHEELKLPGFEEFTDEQMFFISFAGLWCEVATPEYHNRKDILRDPHSPAKYRVLGSISNTQEFEKIFNCPKGSPMNPEDKCSVWMKPEAAPKSKRSRHSRRHHWSEHRNW
ncbi:neprilysin-4 [Diachasma alloeum]|uniref:neprilysin-4 n=1 Tax=Diachasma alloeum TaxID=454923 RepID=UPI0007382E52|nr:neprilysin-4 [Diachasma alloeum]